jgi:hypothetical protein
MHRLKAKAYILCQDETYKSKVHERYYDYLDVIECGYTLIHPIFLNDESVLRTIEMYDLAAEGLGCIIAVNEHFKKHFKNKLDVRVRDDVEQILLVSDVSIKLYNKYKPVYELIVDIKMFMRSIIEMATLDGQIRLIYQNLNIGGTPLFNTEMMRRYRLFNYLNTRVGTNRDKYYSILDRKGDMINYFNVLGIDNITQIQEHDLTLLQFIL